MNKRILSGICVVVMVAASPLAWGQNLLQDPTFLQDENGVDDPLVCGPPFQLPLGPAWTGDTQGKAVRNGSQFLPACPRTGTTNDREWGSIDYGEPSGRRQFFQTVSVTPGKAYLLSGVWAGGTDSGTPMEFGVELREGDENGTIIGQTGGVESGSFSWEPFQAAGTVETGTQLTVVFFVDNAAWGGKGLHVDDLLLEEGTCTDPPAVTSIDPDYGPRGGDLTGVRINGSNFVPGATTPLLRKGGVFITGSSVSVDPSGMWLTCDFDLGPADLGYLDVAVQVAGCPDGILRNGLLIVMPGPGINPWKGNGSFESPNVFPPVGCPVTPQSAPSYWTFSQFDNYGGALYRDENVVFVPGCPPPQGSHYASTKSDHAGGTMRMTQTVIVTPQTDYTLSGYFAGGGDNEVTISLLDGTPDDALLGQVAVHSGGAAYDWTPAFVAGRPTGPLLTVRWQVHNTGSPDEDKSAHADNFILQQCTGAVELTGIEPALALNTGVLGDAAVSGSGFSGENPPQLMLTRPGTAIPATGVVVSDDANLTCDLDLTGLTSGYYDLVILKDGCFNELADALLVVSEGLVNGEFNDPSTGDPNDPNCGSLASGSSGWNYNDDWWRDHFISQPTCPRDVPAPVPPEGYGHYQSMTTGPDRDHRDQRAWQTIAVQSGVYGFSGWFAGGGTNTVNIRLLDGDINGAQIASTEVYSCTSGCGNYDWLEASVTGAASSGLMTVVWEMVGAEDESATHADGLTFVSICSDPFADVDGDGDVDQDDFAALQLCVSGEAPLAAGCECFDQPADGKINQLDIQAFETCASGPDVPADVGCDN